MARYAQVPARLTEDRRAARAIELHLMGAMRLTQGSGALAAQPRDTVHNTREGMTV